MVIHSYDIDCSTKVIYVNKKMLIIIYVIICHLYFIIHLFSSLEQIFGRTILFLRLIMWTRKVIQRACCQYLNNGKAFLAADRFAIE